MKKGEDYTGVSVIFICHDGGGNYLLHKRSVNCRDEHNCWDIGGGGLDFGHTIESVLRREIQEEFGCEVLDYETLGFRDVHREHEGKKTHWIAIDHKVLVDRTKVKNNEPHKFDELEWFCLEDFPEPMHSQWPIFLNQYKDRL